MDTYTAPGNFMNSILLRILTQDSRFVCPGLHTEKRAVMSALTTHARTFDPYYHE